MGGIGINSALQVGVMLRALLSQYGMVHAWVAQKRLKRDILRLFTMSDLLNI
jgi:hypothetical protein